MGLIGSMGNGWAGVVRPLEIAGIIDAIDITGMA